MKNFEIQNIRFYAVILIISLLLPATLLQARSVVLPVEAIEGTKRMSAEEFAQRYPGVDISGSVPDEEGYYVRYRHENLTYYFGPLEDYYDALVVKEDLDEIRELCVISRPELEESVVDIFHFTFDMLSKKKTKSSDQQGGQTGGSMADGGSPSEEGGEYSESQELAEGETVGGESQQLIDTQQSSQESGSMTIPEPVIRIGDKPKNQSSQSGPPMPSSSSSSSSSSSQSMPSQSDNNSSSMPTSSAQVPWWDILRLVFGF